MTYRPYTKSDQLKCRMTDLVSKIFHNSGNGGGAVDEDEAETALRMGHAETSQNVGAGSFTQSDDAVHVQGVDHVNHGVSQGVQTREVVAVSDTNDPKQIDVSNPISGASNK